MSFDKIVDCLENSKPYKPSKSQFVRAVRSRCPACGGGLDKLNVSESTTGKVAIHCFGGCSFPEIIDALNLDASDFFPSEINYSDKSNYKPDTIKGWDWWSLVSAIDTSSELLKYTFIELTDYLPKNDPARMIMLQAVSEIRDLSERLKYGRKVGKQ